MNNLSYGGCEGRWHFPEDNNRRRLQTALNGREERRRIHTGQGFGTKREKCVFLYRRPRCLEENLRLEGVSVDYKCILWAAWTPTILSRFPQDAVLDLVIFFILPVDVVVMLAVVFTPAHPRFSLADEHERLDCGFLGSLHHDSAVDGVSICEGVAAVDGVVFNSKSCNCHPSLPELTEGNELRRNQEAFSYPVQPVW